MIGLKLKPAEKIIHKKVINAIKKKVDQKTAEIVNEVNKKTIIYALWSLAGLFLIFFNLPKIIFYICSFVMILVVAYFLVGFIQSLKKALSFINDFELEIKKIVKKEIKSNTEDSVKNKVGLLLSGLNQKDIENLCIAYFVRELVRKFKKYKRYIFIRLIAYTIAVLLFKEILFRYFHDFILVF